MELADMIREPLPEILYKNLKKNGLPMIEQAKLLSFKIRNDFAKVR